MLPTGAQVELERDLRLREDALDRLFRDTGVPAHITRLRGGVDVGGLRIGGRTLRSSEWRIDAGDPVYVLGIAQERPGLASAKRQQILQKLTALKKDPEAMAHFDRDGSGSVSAEEWEVARQLVNAEFSQSVPDDRVVIAAESGSGFPFVISDRAENTLTTRLRRQSFIRVFGGAFLSALSVWFLLRLLDVASSFFEIFGRL